MSRVCACAACESVQCAVCTSCCVHILFVYMSVDGVCWFLCALCVCTCLVCVCPGRVCVGVCVVLVGCVSVLIGVCRSWCVSALAQGPQSESRPAGAAAWCRLQSRPSCSASPPRTRPPTLPGHILHRPLVTHFTFLIYKSQT